MAEKGSKGGMGGLIMASLVVSLAATGGGFGLGFMLPLSAPAEEKKAETKSEASVAVEPEHPKEEGAVIVHPLPPIVTNLAAPANAWMRLEASLLIDKEAEGEAETLAAKTAEHIMAFIRTVTVAQVEGASGYHHFREDLHDMIAATSEGKVKHIAIASMVIE